MNDMNTSMMYVYDVTMVCYLCIQITYNNMNDVIEINLNRFFSR